MKIIAFDFDRTLFDAERFKIALSKSLKKHNIPEKIWWQTYGGSIPSKLQKYQFYKPEKHAKLIQKLTGVKKEEILNAFHNVVKGTFTLLFKDSEKILKFFKKRGFKLYLVTFGDREHQGEKILYSGIKKYFDKIIISQKPKVSIKFPEGIILVDDNILEIQNLHKKYGDKITLVWLNRKNKKTKLPKSIIEIKNLKSLIKLCNQVTK